MSLNTNLLGEQQAPPIAPLPQSSPLPAEQQCSMGSADSETTGALNKTGFINSLSLVVKI